MGKLTKQVGSLFCLFQSYYGLKMLSVFSVHFWNGANSVFLNVECISYLIWMDFKFTWSERSWAPFHHSVSGHSSISKLFTLWLFSLKPLYRFKANLTEMFDRWYFLWSISEIQYVHQGWLCSELSKFRKFSCQKLLGQLNCNFAEWLLGGLIENLESFAY